MNIDQKRREDAAILMKMFENLALNNGTKQMCDIIREILKKPKILYFLKIYAIITKRKEITFPCLAIGR